MKAKSFREFFESISASGGASLDFEKGDKKKAFKPADTSAPTHPGYPKQKGLFKSPPLVDKSLDKPKEVKASTVAAAYQAGMKMRAKMVQSVTPKEPAKKK